MRDSRGILRPDEARRHFELRRLEPSADLAHLIDRLRDLVQRGVHREIDTTVSRVT